MNNDNKTLADAKPGGRVRLGDQLPPLPYPNYPVSKTGLQNNAYTASQMMDYARAALSAQPSPGGQGDARAEGLLAALVKIRDSTFRDAAALRGIADMAINSDRARDFKLAARQPVGKHGEGEEFLAGICVALQCVTAQDSGVLWAEIVRAVGVDDLLQYATFIEPEEWDLAGFSTYASIELGRRKPRSKASKQAKRPPAHAVDLDELRRAVCVVNVVGQIDGHDVVRRNSLLDVIDNRRQRLTESQAVQP